MKVALIQTKSGTNKEKNVEKAFLLTEIAFKQKAKFVLLPEVFSYRGEIRSKKSFDSVVEKIPGVTTKLFMQLAKSEL